jgi:hypothetical protein
MKKAISLFGALLLFLGIGAYFGVSASAAPAPKRTATITAVSDGQVINYGDTVNPGIVTTGSPGRGFFFQSVWCSGIWWDTPTAYSVDDHFAVTESVTFLDNFYQDSQINEVIPVGDTQCYWNASYFYYPTTSGKQWRMDVLDQVTFVLHRAA